MTSYQIQRAIYQGGIVNELTYLECSKMTWERERERGRSRPWRFWENFRSLVSNKREKVVGLVGLNFIRIVITRPVGIL